MLKSTIALLSSLDLPPVCYSALLKSIMQVHQFISLEDAAGALSAESDEIVLVSRRDSTITASSHRLHELDVERPMTPVEEGSETAGSPDLVAIGHELDELRNDFFLATQDLASPQESCLTHADPEGNRWWGVVEAEVLGPLGDNVPIPSAEEIRECWGWQNGWGWREWAAEEAALGRTHDPLESRTSKAWSSGDESDYNEKAPMLVSRDSAVSSLELNRKDTLYGAKRNSSNTSGADPEPRRPSDQKFDVDDGHPITFVSWDQKPHLLTTVFESRRCSSAASTLSPAGYRVSSGAPPRPKRPHSLPPASKTSSQAVGIDVQTAIRRRSVMVPIKEEKPVRPPRPSSGSRWVSFGTNWAKSVSVSVV